MARNKSASPPYLVLLSFREIHPASGAAVPIFVSHEGYDGFEEGGLNLPLIPVRCERDFLN
jgi:hypothetical protein